MDAIGFELNRQLNIENNSNSQQSNSYIISNKNYENRKFDSSSEKVDYSLSYSISMIKFYLKYLFKRKLLALI